ncbi:hypothetical protein EK21DRAFT_94627 [Setomelanomma holmii]|uniref:Uncharacterized protein n=1 Tax=Setomelanomma holmii TaxID=210430 RepID=A0A9P4GZ43_9PLEO|nr:hypothetical protein EK21DRAFT_94627 [Setomelanomma holmii]
MPTSGSAILHGSGASSPEEASQAVCPVARFHVSEFRIRRIAPGKGSCIIPETIRRRFPSVSSLYLETPGQQSPREGGASSSKIRDIDGLNTYSPQDRPFLVKVSARSTSKGLGFLPSPLHTHTGSRIHLHHLERVYAIQPTEDLAKHGTLSTAVDEGFSADDLVNMIFVDGVDHLGILHTMNAVERLTVLDLQLDDFVANTTESATAASQQKEMRHVSIHRVDVPVPDHLAVQQWRGCHMKALVDTAEFVDIWAKILGAAIDNTRSDMGGDLVNQLERDILSSLNVRQRQEALNIVLARSFFFHFISANDGRGMVRPFLFVAPAVLFRVVEFDFLDTRFVSARVIAISAMFLENWLYNLGDQAAL